MSDVFSDYTQKCSYCLKKVGKANLKSCSRCRFVKYCSRQCQKSAWPTHKAACSTGESLKHKLDQPGNRESKKLNDDFTKWLNYYRNLICTVAKSAFNLANSPPNKLATHCMYLVVERQPDAGAIPFYFRMVSGQIISRQEMVDTFNTMDLTEEQVDSGHATIAAITQCTLSSSSRTCSASSGFPSGTSLAISASIRPKRMG
ncbi:uncharacterized protein B0H18DRAFT_419799 [Fomitopsis serialis]|uniref:uncharacterized protein n=1 Tax=Fomitopsis serialis TaxID=139415 RepID=UPI002008A8B7|nr:uncharacterized protein B0H18DRAFT_419799 [Neoantrodia serialis]KAH9935656.1 hypothetical protein B0H18DRAFT_419799 [Neoantrodia serialis]